MKHISIRFNRRFNFTLVLYKNMFIIALPFMFTITVGDCKDIATYYGLQRIVIQIGKYIYTRRYFKHNVILSQKDANNIKIIMTKPIPNLELNIMVIMVKSFYKYTYYVMDYMNSHLNTASVLILPRRVIGKYSGPALLKYIVYTLCENIVLCTSFMAQLRELMGEDAILILDKVLIDIPLLEEEKKYNFKRINNVNVF